MEALAEELLGEREARDLLLEVPAEDSLLREVTADDLVGHRVHGGLRSTGRSISVGRALEWHIREREKRLAEIKTRLAAIRAETR